MARQLGAIPKAKPRNRERRTKPKAQPARIFEALCAAHNLFEPVPEYRFEPTRDWRFDWAWPEAMVAIEKQGGIFTGGRHVRGPALLQEYEKINAAQALGWCVFFVTPDQMNSGEVFELLKRVVPPANGKNVCRLCGTADAINWTEENLCAACGEKSGSN